MNVGYWLAYPKDTLLFTEVGWGSASPSSAADQALFVSSLPALMSVADPALVIWTVLNDPSTPAPLTASEIAHLKSLSIDPLALFAIIKSDGLFGLQGQPKPSWYAALGLDFGANVALQTAFTGLAPEFATLDEFTALDAPAFSTDPTVAGSVAEPAALGVFFLALLSLGLIAGRARPISLKWAP